MTSDGVVVLFKARGHVASQGIPRSLGCTTLPPGNSSEPGPGLPSQVSPCLSSRAVNQAAGEKSETPSQ